jgi:hypothetical protein
VLDVDVEADLGEPAPGEVRQRVMETDDAPAPRVQHGVGEDELAAEPADIELHHVDAHFDCRVERGERVGRGQRACATVADPLAAGEHHALTMPAVSGGGEC